MQLLYLSALPLLFSSALAQTFTACNPLLKTDCPNNLALGTNATFNLTDSKILDDKLWNTTAGRVFWHDDGADFTIGGQGDSPTVQSKFYLQGGIFTVVMKAASGKGIVSSIVMQSESLDEIDWEFVGGNTTHVQTNYFGKNNTLDKQNMTYDRMKAYEVDDPMNKFHNYTVHWTKDKIDFIIDDNVVRTLTPEEAMNGQNFPQTPLNLRLGIWAGGDPENNSKGTVEWAQGPVDWSEAPFTMSVEGVYVEDFSKGSEYHWKDTSGTWDSIEAIPGESYAQKRIAEPKNVTERWNRLPQGARVGIVAGAISGFAIAVCALLFFCIKQRRLGRREHAKLRDVEEKEEAERLYWKDKVDHNPNKPLGRAI